MVIHRWLAKIYCYAFELWAKSMATAAGRRQAIDITPLCGDTVVPAYETSRTAVGSST